jgi:alpha-ketoglutarate-dependent taurine dioxygenase
MTINTVLRIEPVTPAVGAVIEGVDLRRPLDPETVGTLRQALLEHGVIFLANQDISTEQITAFASSFGTLETDSFGAPQNAEDSARPSDLGPTRRATAMWHSDTTFVAEPPMMTVLRAVELPPIGGDTCWGSMYAAYDALSAPLRAMLDGLTAIHSMMPTVERLGAVGSVYAEAATPKFGVEHAHPVVRVHPETGRKALFVNQVATTRVVELSPAESAHVLALLFDHVKSPDFTMRWRWTPGDGDVALWDNRIVQHYAVPDYDTRRVMQRLCLVGDRPYGPRRSATIA